MSKMTKNKLALLALAGLSAVTSGPVCASAGMTVDSKGGLEVFSLDNHDAFWFKLGGRLLVDQVFYDASDDRNNASDFPSGSAIRSARVALKGGVGQHWVYKLDLDFQDKPGAGGTSRFGEAFIGFDCDDEWFLGVGQFYGPFGIESTASISDLPFMEVSLPTSAFQPPAGIGIRGEWYGHMFTAAGMVYHPGAGFRATGDVISVPVSVPAGTVAGTGPLNSDPGSDDLGFGGRITFSPVHDGYNAYHAGISARHDKMHANANNFNYIARLEAQSRQSPLLFTNIPPNSAKDSTVWGFELAGQWGPFILQGEYMLADVERNDLYPANDLRNPGGSLDYHGYYVEATYVLTGETRAYQFHEGTFGGVKPKSHKGAWEIGLRHSYVDLLDKNLSNNPYFYYIDFVPNGSVDVDGHPTTIAGNHYRTGIDTNDVVGSVHSTTVGLTWWVNNNVKFMANYVRTDFAFGDIDALGLRGQVTFG